MRFLKDFQTEIKTFLIVALVAVVISIGGILLLKITQTPPPAPQSQTLDTSTWQTYRSDEFGFEVRYPKDWKVQQTSPRKIFITDGSVGNFERFTVEKFDDNNLNLSLDKWMAGFAVGRNVRGIPQKILLNGMEAYRIDGEFFSDLYLMSREGSIFVAYLQNDKSGDLTILNQILGTFRFVE